jgi:hypothetical protein
MEVIYPVKDDLNRWPSIGRRRALMIGAALELIFKEIDYDISIDGKVVGVPK